jgi:hypothetical protein
VKNKGKYPSPRRGSLLEESKEQGQDEADDDTGHNGEI